jgi:hypothetical protein
VRKIVKLALPPMPGRGRGGGELERADGATEARPQELLAAV